MSTQLYKDFKNKWTLYFRDIIPAEENGIPNLHLVNRKSNDIFIQTICLDNQFKKIKLPIKKAQVKWHTEYKGKNSYFLFRIKTPQDIQYYLFKSRKIVHLMNEINFKFFEQEALIKENRLDYIVNFLEDVD
jgi:hypothetical protein